MNTCVKCGITGPTEDFVKPRPRHPVTCRQCDRAIQREGRYRRRGIRRRLGELESYDCTRCGGSFERIITSGPPKKLCDQCLRDGFNARARSRSRTVDLKRKYGITPEQADAMLAAQWFRCAICLTDTPGGRHGSWNVDHDHETGAVRGILCDGCNRGLGFFKDDPAHLDAASAYIRNARQLRAA